MLFAPPVLDEADVSVLSRIAELRRQLEYQVAVPRRWVGSLRRVTLARAIQGSNIIEGYNVSLDDAVDAVEGEEPLTAEGETLLATVGYRDALTYILQVADDPYLVIDTSFIRGLHYMMLKHDLSKRPGRWRAGTIYVRNDETGETVYEGPDVAVVPSLMDELATSLEEQKELPREIRGAMAHLNLTMIHPFRDGNGRMARALQTLAISQDGIEAPEFCSIEEYLGRDTAGYYKVLAEVGQGEWHPENSAKPWIRFTLTAHVRQAHRLLRRVRETSELWEAVEQEAARLGLPDRAVEALWSAASGRRLRNVSYRRMADVTDQIASRDLKMLVNAGLLQPHGEKRGRFYVGTPALREFRNATRQSVRVDEHVDPYQQLSLL